MLKGFGVSQGIVIGKAFIKKEIHINIPTDKIEDIEQECLRFEHAKNETLNELHELIQTSTLDASITAIIEAHIHIVNDIELKNQVIQMIKSQRTHAAYAINVVTDTLIDHFLNMNDPMFQERAIDLKDVKLRMLSKIIDIPSTNFTPMTGASILVCQDLHPSDAVQLNPNLIHGMIIENGGKNSHTAIIAKSLNIPTVIGIKNVLKLINENDNLIVDGLSGEVIIDPKEDVIQNYLEKMKLISEEKLLWESVKNTLTQTKDGIHFPIHANINAPQDIQAARIQTAEGVGLYRTEFLYMNRTSLPTENEQMNVYKQLLHTFGQQKVIIRTLDVGGDKNIVSLTMDPEVNPFLGLRGIRFSLKEQHIFKTQLRALLRASVDHQLHIMFPMIATLEELIEAKKIMEEVKNTLQNEGYSYSKNIKIGMMIEVPSSAILADLFADEVDFFSIGTNDLIQYTFAADRNNVAVSNLYQTLHPAVLRLIKIVVDAANKKGKIVSVCGEMASDINALKVLIGLGVHEVSIHPQDVLKCRYEIRQMQAKDLYALSNDMLDLSTEKDVIERLNKGIL